MALELYKEISSLTPRAKFSITPAQSRLRRPSPCAGEGAAGIQVKHQNNATFGDPPPQHQLDLPCPSGDLAAGRRRCHGGCWWSTGELTPTIVLKVFWISQFFQNSESEGMFLIRELMNDDAGASHLRHLHMRCQWSTDMAGMRFS